MYINDDHLVWLYTYIYNDSVASMIVYNRVDEGEMIFSKIIVII